MRLYIGCKIWLDDQSALTEAEGKQIKRGTATPIWDPTAAATGYSETRLYEATTSEWGEQAPGSLKVLLGIIPQATPAARKNGKATALESCASGRFLPRLGVVGGCRPEARMRTRAVCWCVGFVGAAKHCSQVALLFRNDQQALPPVGSEFHLHFRPYLEFCVALSTYISLRLIYDTVFLKKIL
jgi:hypothetical protein